jgi:Sec-independent protein translocase protein TatA
MERLGAHDWIYAVILAFLFFGASTLADLGKALGEALKNLRK